METPVYRVTYIFICLQSWRNLYKESQRPVYKIKTPISRVIKFCQQSHEHVSEALYVCISRNTCLPLLTPLYRVTNHVYRITTQLYIKPQTHVNLYKYHRHLFLICLYSRTPQTLVCFYCVSLMSGVLERIH